MQTRVLAGIGWVVLAAAISGCRMESGKSGDGERSKLATPFGNLQVNTDKSAVESGIGVPVYPGATLSKKDTDSGAADINLSLGSMRLRVKALSYTTGDAPDVVQAFYTKKMERFGVTLTCSGHSPVGQPVRTPEGLTCDDERDGKQLKVKNGNGEIELKAGSEQHQHVVSIEKDGSGTKFALVMVDLPIRLTTHEDQDEDK